MEYFRKWTTRKVGSKVCLVVIKKLKHVKIHMRWLGMNHVVCLIIRLKIDLLDLFIN